MTNVLKERWIEILKILIDNTEPMTISSIEKKIKVSNRTIRNDLKEIEIFFKENDYGRVVRKPRIGVWLEINKDKDKELREIINKGNMYIQPFSPEERQRYILKKLLKASEPTTMEELSEELYVSRVTIFKDLNAIEEKVKKYNLLILRKQNYGIEIIGNEKDFRKLAGDIFKEVKFYGLYGKYTKDLSMFSEENFNFINELLKESEKQMNFFFTDESIISLIFHISISVERVKQNKGIRLSDDKKEEIELQKEYMAANRIAKRLEEKFSIFIPEDEVCYIAIHMMGSKIQQNYFENDNEILKNMNEEIINLSKEIIELIGNILSVDLSEDKELLIGLALHLKPTINRLKYDLTINNPLLSEIKENYPSIFGASWASSVIFEKYYGYKVNEDEIGYIAIHIGAALERQKINTKAIIVCSSGVGTSQLVSIRLKKALPNLEIVDIVSKHEIVNIDSKTFDVVISTVPLEYRSKPVIRVSPFLDEKDILEVKKWIDNIEGIKKIDKSLLNDDYKALFNSSLIFPNIDFKTKEDVINLLHSCLVKNGYVEPAFVHDVFEREKITSTAVGKGIAIPHGNQIYVRKPVIAFASLKEPIDWGGNKVDLVFLLALKSNSKDSIKNFFREFYRIIDDEEMLQKLRKLNSKQELYLLLTSRRGDER